MKNRGIVFAIIAAFILEAKGEVIINELMVNEPGSETALEWIELFNRSDTTILLDRYIFIDANDSTRLPARTVPPHGFAVIARRAISSGGNVSFESYWGNNSGIWGDDSTENYALVEAKFSLRNTSDTVSLLNVNTGDSETVFWRRTPPDGVSLERINPYLAPAVENFAYCKFGSGSTPGRSNSVLAPRRNLGLLQDSIEVEPPVDDSQPLRIRYAVYNNSLEVIDDAFIIFHFDRDLSGDVSSPDLIDSIMLPPLVQGGVASSVYEQCEDRGRKHLSINLSVDDIPDDNQYELLFAVGNRFPELVINEFLVQPHTSLGSQWIELRNVAPYPVSIDGFIIQMVTEGTAAIPLAGLVIAPGELAVVCADSLALVDYYGALSCQIAEQRQWYTLPTEGTIRLVSDLGTLSDSITYSGLLPVGNSWERDRDSTEGDFHSLFYASSDPSGATPCRENSERLLPPEFDLGFSSDGLTVDRSQAAIGRVTFEFEISNLGRLPTGTSGVTLYRDGNYDGHCSPEEELTRLSIPSLASGESTTLHSDQWLEGGHYHIIALLDRDDNEANNWAEAEFSVGPLTRELIITEFLANPTDPVECEWVEVRNISNRAIPISGWSIGDALGSKLIQSDLLLHPEEYLILTQDSSTFLSYYGAGCAVVQVNGWRNLNNSGDQIVITDCFGIISDSLTYSTLGRDNRSVELNEITLTTTERSWYVCTSERGSTPCYPNSVSAVATEEIAVVLSKRVFAPSMGEELLIRITCPPATVVSISIHDLAGRRHYVIADQRQMSTSDIVYSGQSNYLGKLSPGAYVMKIEAGQDNEYITKQGFAVAASR